MPSPIKVGSDEPQLQHWENDYSPFSGTSTSREYVGINLDKMSALAASFTGWSQKLRFEHNVATLTVSRSGITQPGGGTSPFEEITDRWELAVDNESPELFENANMIASVNQFDGTIVISEQIFHCLRASAGKTWSGFWELAKNTKILNASGVATTSATVQYYLLAISATYAAAYAEFKLFADDYLRGQTTFRRGKYVLRHTTIAPNNYSANVADFNVERIYTIAQLLSETQNASYWILPLPDYLAYKIANYDAPSVMNANRQWGGLKSRSNATLAAMGRIEITTEYLIDSWPIHTYGTV